MSLLDTSPLQWVRRVTDFSQRSLDNTLGTITSVQQSIVEVPINIAEELGVAPDKCAYAKAVHRRLLGHVYQGLSASCAEVHDYIVKQATLVDELAAGSDNSTTKPVVDLQARAPRLKKLG